MRAEGLSQFLRQLQDFNSQQDSFNPWSDYDETYDFSPQAPEICLAHLAEYL